MNSTKGELALGFAINGEPWHLISYLFPDKIGGRPAWLALKHLPEPEELCCSLCNEQMAFLMQIYSPIESKVDCFHRFFFLFMCKTGDCHVDCKNNNSDHRTPFIVLRSQLPRCNDYYSYQPPSTETPSLEVLNRLISLNKLPCAELYASMCPVCGCLARKACARCKRVFYCSRTHQVMHWKEEHKTVCTVIQDHTSGPKFTANKFLLPEYKLCSEIASHVPNTNIRGRKCNESSICGLSESEDDEDKPIDDEIKDEHFSNLELLAKTETKEEARFRKFKEAMSLEPDQVVRFQPGGQPLWLSDMVPTIPDCEVCGAQREFQFQVTPQLLHYLKLDSLGNTSPDFGSLYVFACSTSCPLPRPTTLSSTGKPVEYQREVVVRQHVP